MKLPPRDFARALARLPEAVPVAVQEVKAAMMYSVDGPQGLVHRRFTGTLVASEVPFEGAPSDYVRDLEYGPGHQPVSDAELEAVLSAAGAWGIVGWANDAQHLGVPYGIFVEREDSLHLIAFQRLPGVWKASIRAAWADAVARTIKRAA